jgi:poly(3-hydroxybutyrate) depolymerase
VNSEDQRALWAVASTIAFPIVGDRTRATELANRSMAWLEQQPGAVDAPVPWLASHVVAQAIVDPPVPGRSHHDRRAHLAAALGAEHVASRVVFALHILCGYDLATTATLSHRSTENVQQLLAPLLPVTAGIDQLADHPDQSADHPDRRGHPDDAMVAPASDKRRWFRPRGGTVATIIVVLLSVVGVTYPGGARPSFADPPAPSRCDAGGGPGAVTTVAVGPTNRPVRLFVPTGSMSSRAVMLLIGDSGAQPEETVAATGLESAAATEGFVLVTLDGSTGPWNAGEAASGTDDRAYAEAAIRHALTAGCGDPSHVSVVGFGTGAHLAGALACDPALQVRQVVMVHGAYLPSPCARTAPVSVLVEADQTDDVLPMAGGWGSTPTPTTGYTPSSMTDTYDGWAAIDRCGVTSTGEVDPSHVVVSARPGCSAGTQVLARVSNGGGHPWPPDAVGAIVRFVSGS